jgi:hypothetical protein
MQGLRNTLSSSVSGTLSGNAKILFIAPQAGTLESIQATASSDTDATLTAGTKADPNGIIETAVAVGALAVAGTYELSDMDGALMNTDGITPFSFAKGTVFQIDVDYDGSSGTAAADLVVQLTYFEA